jgi:hypothetical protein
MKPSPKNPSDLRKQIMKSAIASFKIEGIKISNRAAENSLKRVEAKLGRLSK